MSITATSQLSHITQGQIKSGKIMRLAFNYQGTELLLIKKKTLLKVPSNMNKAREIIETIIKTII